VRVRTLTQPVSSSSTGHADDKPSTSDNQVGSKKGRVKFHCLLCKDMHHIYLCYHMDEASYLLEMIVDVQKQLPYPNPPLVDELVNIVPSLVNIVDHVIHPVPSSVYLVDQVIDSISPSISHYPLGDRTKSGRSNTTISQSHSSFEEWECHYGLSCYYGLFWRRGHFTHSNGTPSE
jgi:hypothetical protein